VRVNNNPDGYPSPLSPRGVARDWLFLSAIFGDPFFLQSKVSFAKIILGVLMQVAEIELYEILKTKLGDKEAKNLVEYLEAKVDKRFEEK
jgi:hypothetical protein